MFKKYARTIVSPLLRNKLYKVFLIRNIMCGLFFGLGILCLFLEKLSLDEKALPIIGVFFLVLIAFLVYVAKFSKLYKQILAYESTAIKESESEQSDQAVIRHKQAVLDESAEMKKFMRPWLIAFILLLIVGVVLMIVGIFLEDADYGGVPKLLNLLGGAVIGVAVFAYMAGLIIFINKKQQKNASDDLKKIDESQGRRYKYSVETDPAINNLKYIFPSEDLREEVKPYQALYKKLLLIAIFAPIVIIIIGLLVWQLAFSGANIEWSLPSALVLYLMAIMLVPMFPKSKISKLELAQQARIKDLPEYKLHRDVYAIQIKFAKTWARIMFYGVFVGAVIISVIAAIFELLFWGSIIVLFWMISLTFLYNKRFGAMRMKAMVVEQEIDRIEAHNTESEQVEEPNNSASLPIE